MTTKQKVNVLDPKTNNRLLPN